MKMIELTRYLRDAMVVFYSFGFSDFVCPSKNRTFSRWEHIIVMCMIFFNSSSFLGSMNTYSC